jgi:hypothetical protein
MPELEPGDLAMLAFDAVHQGIYVCFGLGRLTEPPEQIYP